MKQELKDVNTSHGIELRSIQERFLIEKEQLTNEIFRMQNEKLHCGSSSSKNQHSSSSQKTTNICSQCRSVISPIRNMPFSQSSKGDNYNEAFIADSLNKTNELESLDKRISSISVSSNTNKKMFFKRNNASCACACLGCQAAHGADNLQPPMAQTTTNHYLKMQKQFLEKSLQNGNQKLIFQQDQTDMLKIQKDINKLLLAEKRSSATKKRTANNNSHNVGSYVSTGTPDKNNIKSIMNALNLSMSSAHSASRKHNVRLKRDLCRRRRAAGGRRPPTGARPRTTPTSRRSRCTRN